MPDPATPSRPSARDVLVQARRLIEDPAVWAQRDQVKDPCRHCAYTAVFTVTEGEAGFNAANSALRRQMGGSPVVTFNDNHTHGEVLAAFDRAIAYAEGR